MTLSFKKVAHAVHAILNALIEHLCQHYFSSDYIFEPGIKLQMMKGEAWSNDELDAIVADYFAMLNMELRGIPFVKSHHNRNLQKIVHRTKQSIEYKHCNITAVLEELGVSGINGYKRRDNYQRALIVAIERFLDNFGDSILGEVPKTPNLVHGSIKIIDPPAFHLSNTPKPLDLVRIVQRFDPVERDRLNRDLGMAGEKAILAHEIFQLKANGCHDLAEQVKHESVETGDGLGYDILSFDLEGKKKLIEVKTTRGGPRTHFFMSRNEREMSQNLADSYYLYRLCKFGPNPELFILRPPLEKSLTFTTETWRAQFA